MDSLIVILYSILPTYALINYIATVAGQMVILQSTGVDSSTVRAIQHLMRQDLLKTSKFY